MYRYNPFTDNLDYFGSSTQSPLPFIAVSSLSDLPLPVGGVITLLPEEYYFFFNIVDLGGLILDVNTAVLGGINQEYGGLLNGLVIVNQTTTIRDILFDACTITISNTLAAYDWDRINFFNSEVIVQSAQNLILDTIGFINSTLRLTGTIDSLVIAPNCIWRSNTNPTAILFRVEATAVINRRIRIQDSVFSTDFVTQTSILFETTNLPFESFILKTVRHTGAGTAVVGINGDSDYVFFFEAIGGNFINSTVIASMYLQDNATPTPVVLGVETEVEGTFTIGAVRQRFVQDGNYLVYTSQIPRIVIITMNYTVFSGNNNVIGCYIAVNRDGIVNPATDVLPESEMYTTTNGTRPENSSTQAITTLNFGDRIYAAVENNSNSTDIIVSFMNLLITKAPV